MIFGRNKKNNNIEKQSSRPLESAAINRWKSVSSEDQSTDSDFHKDDYFRGEDVIQKDIPFNQLQSENTDFEKDQVGDFNLPDNQNEVDCHSDSAFEHKSYSSQMGVSFNDHGPVNDNETSEVLNEYEEEADDYDVGLSAEDEVLEDEYYEDSNSEENYIPPREITPPADFNLNYEEDIKQRFGGNLKSALGSGTMIEGMFSFDSPVKIDGVLTGEIKSNSALIVGPSAKVSAKIQVGSLIVLGKVEGDIEAVDLIEIRSSGSLEGDVITRRIALEEGGMFNGACTMLD